MFTLDEIALHHGADKSTKFHGYTPVYDRLFTPLRPSPIRLLEIGIEFGKSMRVWLDYFPRAEVFGVDINPQFKWSDPRYHEIVADQSNVEAMQQVADRGPFDIVIDDGCHRADAAIVSFKALWPAVKSGGLYIVEDVGTYWHPMYQSTAQGWTWLHGFVDDVNQRGKDFYGAPAYTSPPGGLELELKSACFYKGLVVLERR